MVERTQEEHTWDGLRGGWMIDILTLSQKKFKCNMLLILNIQTMINGNLISGVGHYLSN